MKEKTPAAAAGRWDGILRALTPELELAIDSNKHIPCPVHGGKDGFRMFKDGSGGGVCNSCGTFSDGFKLLKWLRNWDFPRAAREVDLIIGNIDKDSPRKEKPDPLIRLKATQEKAGPVGKFVADYLKGRGLSKMPPGLHQGKLDYYDNGKRVGSYITMMAKVVSPQGRPLTWHLTYLEGSSKAAVSAPKKMLTPAGKITGAAIRLWPVAEHIGVAEGIETAIAARELTGLPVWAVLNTAIMESFLPPEGVKEVTVFSDNDANYAGQKAAYTLANRLSLSGVPVHVEVPDRIGDWLDKLNGWKDAP